MTDEHAPNPLDEVQDHGDVNSPYWTFFHDFFGRGPVRIELLHFPHPLRWVNDLLGVKIFEQEFVLTKFMILELVAAALLLAIFIPLARRAQDGALPKGKWWNLGEGLLTFLRDDVARPLLGPRDADRFLPFLWTTFLFILVLNLMGMLP